MNSAKTAGWEPPTAGERQEQPTASRRGAMPDSAIIAPARGLALLHARQTRSSAVLSAKVRIDHTPMGSTLSLTPGMPLTSKCMPSSKSVSHRDLAIGRNRYALASLTTRCPRRCLVKLARRPVGRFEHKARVRRAHVPYSEVGRVGRDGGCERQATSSGQLERGTNTCRANGRVPARWLGLAIGAGPRPGLPSPPRSWRSRPRISRHRVSRAVRNVDTIDLR